MTNKKTFLTKYREEIQARYAWAESTDKLDKFMSSVEGTINTSKSTWICEGAAVAAAWRASGGAGEPTLKALRALP